MKADIRNVTPAMAQKWLGDNPLNRNVRLNRVEEYARDMEHGRWIINGESIILDDAGKLIDGQHRLLAVLVHGKPVKMLVVEGVGEEARATIDTGMKRSLADILKMRGATNVHSLAAAVVMGWRWETGGIREARNASRSDALAWLDKNPAIRDGLKLASPLTTSPLRMPPSIAAPLLFFAETVSSYEDVLGFVNEVAEGVALTENSGTFRLRKYLLDTSNPSYHRGAPAFVKLAIAVKAWNSWIEGTEVKNLSWRAGGASAEPFPTLRGPKGLFSEGPERPVLRSMSRRISTADTTALAKEITKA